jgi:hypothetical protein
MLQTVLSRADVSPLPASSQKSALHISLPDVSELMSSCTCCAYAPAGCAAGSAEQGECDQQLVAAVKRLTRQQLADMLLQQLEQQQQHKGEEEDTAIDCTATVSAVHSAGLITGPALSLSDCEFEEQQQQQQQQQVAIGLAITASTTSSSLMVSNCGSNNELHHAELREAMFQLVKAQQQQQQGAGLTKYQAMLLKWLKANCSSSSSASRQRANPAAAAGDVVRVEVLLLRAELSVKLKMWQQAQQTAAAAELALRDMVSGRALG